MQLFENIILALQSLAANKMRALLTMLGIIIGISAVITITTIGNSIQKTLSNTFNQFGSLNYLSLYVNDKRYLDDDFSGLIDDEEEEERILTEEDFMTREMLNKLVETYPDYFSLEISDSFGKASLQNPEGKSIQIALSGVVDGVPGKDMAYGRCISLRDNLENRRTIMVSDIFVRQYFGKDINALGKTVEVTLATGNAYSFTIVGVYKYDASIYGAFLPNTKEIERVTPATVPYDTMCSLLGIEEEPMYSASVRWNMDYDAKVQKQAAQDFFEEQYAGNPYWGIYVSNDNDQLGMINTVINVVTIAISIIAAISLIVGGVGVMNIMLVSITERTKEIGIRKALGAQNSAIRLQFVIEAILICLIGGVIGIVLGILNGVVISLIAKQLILTLASQYAKFIIITVEPSVTAILISVFFSMLTGVFFGYYPANKAAKMNPIDALRYEG